jgi:hypothetical protein
MKSTIRLFISAIAALATFYFVSLVPFSIILQGGQLLWVRILGSLLCTTVVTRYVWRRSASLTQGLAIFVVMGALVTGGIGFTAGFFGPMIFAPGANQGPMLGIFFTGPLGVVVGAIGGGIYWRARVRRAESDNPKQGDD